MPDALPLVFGATIVITVLVLVAAVLGPFLMHAAQNAGARFRLSYEQSRGRYLDYSPDDWIRATGGTPTSAAGLLAGARHRAAGGLLVGSIICEVAASVVIVQQATDADDDIRRFAIQEAVADRALGAAVGTLLQEAGRVDSDLLDRYPMLRAPISKSQEASLAEYLVTVWVAQQAAYEDGVDGLATKWLLSVAIAVLVAVGALLSAIAVLLGRGGGEAAT